MDDGGSSPFYMGDGIVVCEKIKNEKGWCAVVWCGVWDG